MIRVKISNLTRFKVQKLWMASDNGGSVIENIGHFIFIFKKRYKMLLKMEINVRWWTTHSFPVRYQRLIPG